MNPFTSPTRRLFSIAALAASIFIIMGSLAVGSTHQVSLDKLIHGVGYALLGFLIITGLSNKFYFPAIVIIILAGILLEFAQIKVIRTRSFDIDDIFANVIGLIIGCIIGFIVCRIWKQLRRKIVAAGERRRTHTYQNGEIIFELGDPGDYLYVIRSGKVALINEAEKIFAHASVEEVIGEMAVINQEPRSATAQAVGETILYRLDIAALEKTIEGQEHPALRVARVLAKRLRESNEKYSSN